MRWLAELRTFARPERPAEPPPGAGERAPETFGPGPRLVVFLRHVGCPFAEATARELEIWRRRLPALPMTIFTQGDAMQLERWLESIGARALEARADDDAFRRWRIPVTSAGHFLGPRSLGGVLRLAPRGIRNRPPAGSRWRSAAAFLLDGAGHIAWRHLPAHAADLPPLEPVIARLETLRARGGDDA